MVADYEHRLVVFQLLHHFAESVPRVVGQKGIDVLVAPESAVLTQHLVRIEGGLRLVLVDPALQSAVETLDVYVAQVDQLFESAAQDH